MAVSKPNVASKCSLESSRRDLHSALLWWQNVARFRLDRHRSLQENTRLAAFFNIYQTITLKCLEMWQDFCKKYNNNNVCKKQFCKHLQNSANFRKIENFKMILKIFVKFGNVLTIFRKTSVLLDLCNGVHCGDLGESFQTYIYLQNLPSIQPRTSPRKVCKS